MNQFSWGVNSPKRRQRNATIGGEELPALAALQILDVGESGVLQLFC